MTRFSVGLTQGVDPAPEGTSSFSCDADPVNGIQQVQNGVCEIVKRTIES